MRVGIALGSNLGDRAARLRAAVRALRSLGEPPILVSHAYETAPVDCPPGSANFLNAAVEIGWPGEIHHLLGELQRLEREAGRLVVRDRNSPRPLDLDILYADDLRLREPELIVPHPRILERTFVLVPLEEIAPHRRLPNAASTIREILDAFGKEEISQIKKLESIY